ncbi:MAG: cell division ATP-binding protein FtsE [Eubacteriales bacterium]
MINFNNINKIYDKTNHLALSNINIQIKKGEFVFIVGKSGAGKTTFMKMVLKELDPTSGSIYVDNQNITKIKNKEIPYYRRKLGVVFQDFRLLTDKTVYENVAFAMEIVEKSRSEIDGRVPDALKQVGLSHRAHYYPDQLSGGEQQRVSLARAIINNPRLIICDEPTGNLDPKTSMGIMTLLEDINNKNGTTVIMATHDKDIVDELQKRVITLHGGKVVGDQKGGYHGEN